jgi:hypothetical protein
MESNILQSCPFPKGYLVLLLFLWHKITYLLHGSECVDLLGQETFNFCPIISLRCIPYSLYNCAYHAIQPECRREGVS